MVPLVVMTVAFIGGLITARTLLVPDSFGDFGHYRADNTAEVAALELAYAGAQACGDCHDDVFETKRASAPFGRCLRIVPRSGPGSRGGSR